MNPLLMDKTILSSIRLTRMKYLGTIFVVLILQLNIQSGIMLTSDIYNV